MRLREFKEPRQRIDEVVVAGIPLATYIYGLLFAGGAMVAGDPRTQKVIQKKIEQWTDSNPGEAQVYADQIKQGQDAGALPKDPSKIGDVAFPVVSALSSAWDWLTGGSTTGTKPAQPGDYVKDKNGMLRRKETAAEVNKMISDVIANNTTRFDNQANARKALPSLKDGTVVTIGGKTYKVSPDAGGRLSAEKRGFVPYQDIGNVSSRPTTGQVDDIDDFEVSPSTSADDDAVATPKPSAGSTGTSWLDRVSDTIGGMFNTVTGAVGGLFGSEDDVKTNIPPATAPDINIGKEPTASGASTTTQGNTVGMPGDRTGEKVPPVVRPGDEAGQGVPGATSGTSSGTGTGAQTGAQTGATTGTGAQTQAQTQAQAQAQANATTGTVATTTVQTPQAVQVAPPVTPPPIVVPPAKPKIKTEPYKGQDVFYTGWRKGPPKNVVSLRSR